MENYGLNYYKFLVISLLFLLFMYNQIIEYKIKEIKYNLNNAYEEIKIQKIIDNKLFSTLNNQQVQIKKIQDINKELTFIGISAWLKSDINKFEINNLLQDYDNKYLRP